MSIPAKFMEVARGKLDGSVFDEIYQRAVALDRKQQMIAPVSAPIEKPQVMARVEAHLNGESKPIEVPHIQERIERRLEIDVTSTDLGDLLRVAKGGGPNVQVVRQVMDLVQECVVNWRGKHFVVIYSKSRDKLITAFPKKKKPPKRMKSGRPKDWRSSDIEDESYTAPDPQSANRSLNTGR